MICISGFEELDNFIINNNDDNILVLYFGVNRCSPCNMLKERILKNKNEMSKLLLCYIDVDLKENKEIIYNYNIKILPTLIFIKLNEDNVTIIDQIIGYDWIKLDMIYKKLVNSSTI